MIWYYVILFCTTLLTAVFTWIPKVTVLPAIIGIDTDYWMNLVFSDAFAFLTVLWPLQDIYYASLFLLTYYVFKNIVLKLFLGNRIH